MSDKVGRQLWEDIVLFTSRSRSDCIRSLRIALFFLLSGDGSLLGQAKRLISTVRRLFPGRKKVVETVQSGRLLFCFPHRTASNIKNLLPVAREAHRRGQLGGIVAFSDFSKDLAEFIGHVPIVTAEALVSQLGIRQRIEVAKEAICTFREISRTLSGVDIHLAARYRRNAGTALADIVTSLLMGRAFQVLLNSWSPSCVVSTSDLWPLEYQLAHQASRKKIPSFVVQHGSAIYFYWPFAASFCLVWGEQSLDEMIAIGTPADRLIVGGMPASDTLFSTVRATGSIGRTPTDHPVCLILSHTNGSYLEPDLFANYKRFLSELVPATPFVRWKVKLHPSEDRSFYDDLDPEALARLEFYPKSTRLEHALQEADIATTLYSTSGLEAMIAGCPLIVPIVSPRMTEPNLLPQVPGALFLHTPEEFAQALKSLVSNADYRTRRLELQREALNHCFSNQGHASQAIMDLIGQHLNSKSVPQAIGVIGMV